MRVREDGAVSAESEWRKDGDVDVINLVTSKVKQGLWEILADKRYNFGGLDQGVSEGLPMKWHKQLKEGPWKRMFGNGDGGWSLHAVDGDASGMVGRIGALIVGPRLPTLSICFGIARFWRGAAKQDGRGVTVQGGQRIAGHRGFGIVG